MRRSALAALLAVILLLSPTAAKAEPEEGTISVAAGGAALIEAHGDRLLFEKDGGKRLPMASTTKIMTALIALERGDMADMVRIPSEAAGVEGSSMYLSAGETISLSDLLYGLMLTSGNDAAVAIAIHVGGSVEGFIELMNLRAEELNCADTHFVTPNGLHDDNHYTTARDLARIASAAMELPAFCELVKTTFHETATGDHKRVLKNKNRVLWQYDGGCGIKTGYTRAAGKCLVFSAERGDTLLIGVALNAPDMWEAAYSLMDYGFALVETERFVQAGALLTGLSVAGGRKLDLAVSAKEDILYAIRRDGAERPEVRLDLPESVSAPVRKGQTLGTAALYVDGTRVAETELVAMESVERRTFFDDLSDVLQRFSA